MPQKANRFTLLMHDKTKRPKAKQLQAIPTILIWNKI